MSIKAVITNIEFAADKPLVFAFGEIFNKNFIPLFKPMQFICFLGPKLFRVFN
jgi:hypothetical protein